MTADKCFIQKRNCRIYRVDLDLQMSEYMQYCAVGSYNNKIFISNKIYNYCVE